METFWIILPFIAIFLIGRIIYDKYKNNDKEKKVSKLRQYWLDSYIRLIFVERVNLRPSIVTIIFYIVIIFSFPLFIFGVFANLQDLMYPSLVLEKMQIKEGVIKSIILRKKMRDLLILTTKDGKDKKFAYTAFKGEIYTLPNQRVKVWYSRGWSSAYSIDNIIYEITKDGKTIRKYSYDYHKRLETKKSLWNFTKYCFYIVLFSALMIWIPNRKELPVHRLNRMKLYKKNKEEK